MTWDTYVAVGLMIFIGTSTSAYAVRLLFAGRARLDRLDKDGGSALLSLPIMELGYWILRPVVTFLNRLGATPNMVTLFAVLPALLGAAFVSQGAFATLAMLGTISAFSDALDGLLAQRQGGGTRGGQALDSVMDRVTESVMLIGVAIFFRDSGVLLGMTLLALFGGYMTSYVSAKAEVMGVTLSRGAMRRPERAVYLLASSSVTPLWALLMPAGAMPALRYLPVVVAVVVIGVVSTLSAALRLRAMVGALDLGNAPARPSSRPRTQELVPLAVAQDRFTQTKSRGLA